MDNVSPLAKLLATSSTVDLPPMLADQGASPQRYILQNWPLEKWRPADVRTMTEYNQTVQPPTAKEVLQPFIYLHALRGMNTSRKDGDAMDFSPLTWLPPSRERLPENI